MILISLLIAVMFLLMIKSQIHFLFERRYNDRMKPYSWWIQYSFFSYWGSLSRDKAEQWEMSAEAAGIGLFPYFTKDKGGLATVLNIVSGIYLISLIAFFSYLIFIAS